MKKKKDRLHDKAWKLMSEYVRQKEKGRCFTCWDKRPWKEQQAGHYIHKKCVDFHFINIHCQCVHCNKWLSGNMGIYAERLIKKYGIKAVEDLRFQSNQVRKFTIEELNEIIRELERRLK